MLKPLRRVCIACNTDLPIARFGRCRGKSGKAYRLRKCKTCTQAYHLARQREEAAQRIEQVLVPALAALKNHGPMTAKEIGDRIKRGSRTVARYLAMSDRVMKTSFVIGQWAVSVWHLPGQDPDTRSPIRRFRSPKPVAKPAKPAYISKGDTQNAAWFAQLQAEIAAKKAAQAARGMV